MATQPSTDWMAVEPPIGQPREYTPRSDGASRVRIPTARPTTSHRRLVSSSVHKWVFLDNEGLNPTATPRDSTAPRVRRPATAREKAASRSNGPEETKVAKPRRPHTSRARSGSSENHPTPGVLSVTRDFARVMKEAAKHEEDQEQYVDPLLGRGVELQSDPLSTATREATQVTSNLKEFHKAKALHSRSKGDYKAAIRHYEKLVQLAPTDGDSLFHLAVGYERVGELDRARLTYQKALAVDATNPFVHFNIGNIHMRSGRLQEAIESYSLAIQDSRGVASHHIVAFYCQRGAAYRKNGDFERAAQDYALLRQGAAICNSISHPSSDRSSSIVQQQMAPHQRPPTRNASGTTPPAISPSLSANRGAYTSKLMYNGNAHNQDNETRGHYEDWRLKEMLRVAAMDPTLRSPTDVEALADYLQSWFTFCALLDRQVCLKLCERVVTVELEPNIPVFGENDQGRCMYFVCRGRIAASITRVHPLSERGTNQDAIRPTNQKAAVTPLLSWERCQVDDCGDLEGELEPEPVRTNWVDSQMHLSYLEPRSVFGTQGRCSKRNRLYSAVVATECTLLALSWTHLHEIENAQRAAQQYSVSQFLRTVPLLHDATTTELDNLALRAKPAKIVGSKVLCTEGQHVGGLIIVREGELCQLSPSDLPTPPNLSVSFNLCGSLSGQHREQEQNAREFFSQLEYDDDPMAFLEISREFHGFLPTQYISERLDALQSLTARSSSKREQSVAATKTAYLRDRSTDASVVAKAVRRGECFCACSSWIPVGSSSQIQPGGRGVTCAKTALVSRRSTDILFFESSDLKETLSESTRAAMHKEIQSLTPASEPERSKNPMSRRFLSYQPTSNLLDQAQHEQAWSQYKQRLMKELATEKAQRRHLRCQSAR